MSKAAEELGKVRTGKCLLNLANARVLCRENREGVAEEGKLDCWKLSERQLESSNEKEVEGLDGARKGQGDKGFLSVWHGSFELAYE